MGYPHLLGLTTCLSDWECCFVAFEGAPEELDVTIIGPAGQQTGAIERAAAALTAEVMRCAVMYLSR